MVEGNQIVNHLKERNLINERESEIIKGAVSAKALNNPINMDNILRANVLRQVIISLIKGRE